MTDPTITCPNCKTEIKLTESLAAPLLEAIRQQYEKQLSAKDNELAEKLKTERSTIAAEEAKKARMLVATDLESKTNELAELKEVVKQRDAKLGEAQKAQAELIRKERELDDAKREMELTIEKRVQESLTAVRDKAKLDAEESLKLKVLEKEQTITSMQKQIEELKRKAEQGSQQLQGEVQELDLEATVKSAFPMDSVEPVPKGEHGGDLIHGIIGPAGQNCGKILWESKRTKNWSDGWLAKLRDDQRAAKAQLAILVSQELPKGVTAFTQIDGVWITNRACALGLATALRAGLIEVAGAKRSQEGRQGKMELLYNYLSGPEFRHRVEGIVEAFATLRDDLEREKRATQKLWAKREKQLERALTNTAGFYGDLSGIVGASLPQIEKLELPALTDESNVAPDAVTEE